MDKYLVGGLEPWNFMTSHSVGNVIIPTDQVIFLRGVAQPPTRYGTGFDPYPVERCQGRPSTSAVDGEFLMANCVIGDPVY